MWRKYPLAWLLFSLLSCPCAAMINPLHWELPLDLEPPTALPTKAFSLLAEASPQENNRELMSEIPECVRFSCACVGRHPRSSNGRSTVAYPSEYSFFDEVL